MPALSDLRALTPSQRNAVIASFLGWTLDAFDFFILVFVLKYVSEEFGTDITRVTTALTLTLAMRPVGALLFGYMADTFGRRIILLANVLANSILEFASGFAPSLTRSSSLRALYGSAIGGEWSVGLRSSSACQAAFAPAAASRSTSRNAANWCPGFSSGLFECLSAAAES